MTDKLMNETLKLLGENVNESKTLNESAGSDRLQKIADTIHNLTLRDFNFALSTAKADLDKAKDKEHEDLRIGLNYILEDFEGLADNIKEAVKKAYKKLGL